MSDRRASAHDRMSAHVAAQLHVDDPTTVAARSAVAVARARLDHCRRAFMRREAGRTDVAVAEHALSAALDELDRVTRDADR